MTARTEWGAGPWDHEADLYRLHNRGYSCLIARSDSGALCGYLAVPPGHLWHGVGYSELDVEVHGGLTYSGRGEAGTLIRDALAPAEPDDSWWLGFDCMHGFDLVPRMDVTARSLGIARPDFSTLLINYKDIGYVSRQLDKLAEQVYRTALQ